MTIADFFTHTPIWVYVLFVYLVSRGIKGLKPGDVNLKTLAIIPIVFTVWGGHQLVHLYGLAGLRSASRSVSFSCARPRLRSTGRAASCTVRGI